MVECEPGKNIRATLMEDLMTMRRKRVENMNIFGTPGTRSEE